MKPRVFRIILGILLLGILMSGASCDTIKVSVKMTSPVISADNYYATNDYTVKFELLSNTDVGFTLISMSDKALRIIWDECSFIEPTGESKRVIHLGADIAQRDRPMPPTLVPPRTTLKDLVQPTDRISWSTYFRDWVHGKLLKKGDMNFGVYLAMEIGGQRQDQLFKFDVTDLNK